MLTELDKISQGRTDHVDDIMNDIRRIPVVFWSRVLVISET
jgi:hypothetical protein